MSLCLSGTWWRSVPLLLALLASMPAAQPQLPQGFTDESLAQGLQFPTSFAFLPDGRMLVTEQAGSVKVVTRTGVGLVGTVPGVALNNTERGLLGIAVDPAWPEEPFIYLHYNHETPPQVMIVRSRLSGSLSDPGSTSLAATTAYVVLDGIPDNDPLHNGGTLRFGTDGMLYASTGDDHSGCLAQTPGSLAGSILRLDVEGLHQATGGGPPPRSALRAPGNPFAGVDAGLVWAYGLRNPWRFNVDPVTGRLYVGDVGPAVFEEVDEVTGPGQNFGWPWMEGPAPYTTCPQGTVAFTAPAVAYDRTGSGAAVLPFGGRYRNLPGAPYNFGPAYEGDLLVGDFVQGVVKRYEHEAGAWQPAASVPGQPGAHWAAGLSFVSDVQEGPDGALYYLTWTPNGELRRIRPDAGAFQLQVVQGDGQAVNAGQQAHELLVVRCTDASGAPVPGMRVTFQVVEGEARLGAQPRLTAPDGTAATRLMAPAPPEGSTIRVRASVTAAQPVVFTLAWRGLDGSYNAATGTLSLTVRHSEPSSPFTLGVVPEPASPIPTPLGPLLVDPITGPPWSLDGLGLFGPPLPWALTAPVTAEARLEVSGIPPAFTGFDLVFQAFAVDSGRLPAWDAFMMSNGVTISF